MKSLFKIPLLLAFGFILFGFQTSKTPKKLYPKLEKYVKTLPSEFGQIDEKRQKQLQEVGDYIVSKLKDNQEVKLTVICTHNSRRSHMGQIWLQAAAHYYGIQNIKTFSGGTEATAFNLRAVKALQEVGFKINQTDKNATENPRYEGTFSDDIPGETMFSKKYADQTNPQEKYAAILVCSSADKACPMVFGADARFAIPFEDPKNFDGTPQESEKYLERCRQIAREMFFVMDYAQRTLAEN